MYSKKTICTLLLAAILLPVMTACAGNTSDETESAPVSAEIAETETETERETTEKEARMAIADDVPEMDFGGHDFIVLASYPDYWITEEMNGEVVNDATYNRNLTVEERFNVTVKTAQVTNNVGAIKKACNAGDAEAFHLVSHHCVENAGVASSGFYIDWYSLPYIDFTKPWWSPSNINDLTVNDRCLLAIGDAGYSALSMTYVVYYNKDMAAKYGIENLYDVIRDGKWTFDYLMSLSGDVTSDSNGNGTMDKDDFYCLATDVNSNISNYLWAFDNQVFERNQDTGELEFVYYSERLVDVFAKLYSWFCETETIYQSTDHGGGIFKFADGGSLFANGQLWHAITYLQDFNDVYGILPYPKFDEAQAAYKTSVDGSHEAMAIARNAKDFEFIGAVTEVLCAEAYKQIIPAYYDVCLKSRYSNSPDDAEMIELSVDSRVFDFGPTYDNWKGCSFYISGLIGYDKTKDITSYFEKNEKSVTAHYNNVMKVFYKEK